MLPYLYLTLNHFICEGQGPAHFECAYFENGERYVKHWNCHRIETWKSYEIFRLPYFHLILARSKGQGHGQGHARFHWELTLFMESSQTFSWKYVGCYTTILG